MSRILRQFTFSKNVPATIPALLLWVGYRASSPNLSPKVSMTRGYFVPVAWSVVHRLGMSLPTFRWFRYKSLYSVCGTSLYLVDTLRYPAGELMRLLMSPPQEKEPPTWSDNRL